MRVMRCVGGDLERRCIELANLVAEAELPDLLVGIRTGGAEVARLMMGAGGLDVPYIEIVAARPDSVWKRRLGLNVLAQAIPHPVLDAVHGWEMRRKARRFNRVTPEPRDLDVSGEARAALASATRVLVVDDAVDSGSTARAVVDLIESLNPGATTRLAALTVTFPRPLVEPDFVTARGVVLRFPWSIGGRRGHKTRS